MESGPKWSLSLQRMPEGGYLVTDDPLSGSGMMRQMFLAATTIDEALAFMRNKLKPIEPEDG